MLRSVIVAEHLPPGVKILGEFYLIAKSYGLKMDFSIKEDGEPYTMSGKYVTPKEIWGSDATLFKSNRTDQLAANFNDVNQGALGDCWLMSAISAIARYGDVGTGTSKRNVIKSLFADIHTPPGEDIPDKVTIRLRNADKEVDGRSKEEVLQTVTTNIVVGSNNRPLFTRSDENGEFWPNMLEKAIAASLIRTKPDRPGYLALHGGLMSGGLSMLLPGIPVYCYFTSNPTPEQLYTNWDALMKSGITICNSWNRTERLTKNEPAKLNGLILTHAFTVCSIVAYKDDEIDVKLALFRNPWGSGNCSYNADSGGGEWTGDWSDCSPQWAKYPKVAAACSFKARRDGLFWMSFQDIANHIGNVELFIPEDPDLRAVDLRVSPFLNERDPCHNVDCQNNGKCVNGDCKCPPGFYGTSCETVSPWTCVPNNGSWTPVKVNGSKEIECFSKDAKSCTTAKTKEDCIYIPAKNGEPQPLSCGLSLANYSNPNHWCAIGRKELGNKDPCSVVQCHNGGECNGGVCQCTPGFIGAQCNIASSWTCISKGSTWSPVRLNDKKDVECLSLDGQICTSAPTKNNCIQTVVNLQDKPLQPLVCGEAHQKLYGSSGYSQPGHWCASGRKELDGQGSCDNVECLNKGSCLHGQCVCSFGYTGPKCETATPWACISAMNSFIPVRVNDKKDVECHSLNAKNCTKAATKELCNTIAVTPKIDPILPLSCGEMHNKFYGNTGYTSPTAWCSIGRKELGSTK